MNLFFLCIGSGYFLVLLDIRCNVLEELDPLRELVVGMMYWVCGGNGWCVVFRLVICFVFLGGNLDVGCGMVI